MNNQQSLGGGAHGFLPLKGKNSFTLAEVLITLGIIGVVAAMTLPALIQKQNEKATVVQLKKAYSMLSQAVLAEIAENGTVDNWNLGNTDIGLKDDNGNSILDNTGREKFAQILKKHLKVISTPQEGDFQFYTLDGTYVESLSKDNALKNMVMTPDGTIYNVGYTNGSSECRKGLYHCIDMVIMLKPEKICFILEYTKTVWYRLELKTVQLIRLKITVSPPQNPVRKDAAAQLG